MFISFNRSRAASASAQLRGARFVTLFDQRFDLRHFAVVNLSAPLQELLRLLLQQAEHLRQLAQFRRHAVGRRHVFTLEAVNLARQIEQRRVSFRGVEVVVHRFAEAGFERFAAGRRGVGVGAAQRYRGAPARCAPV